MLVEEREVGRDEPRAEKGTRTCWGEEGGGGEVSDFCLSDL